jgi:hypothetical protein
LQKAIARKKFYTTLPHKLDNAVDDYKKQVGHTDPVIETEVTEHGTFGEDGWSIRKRLKHRDTNA